MLFYKLSLLVLLLCFNTPAGAQQPERLLAPSAADVRLDSIHSFLGPKYSYKTAGRDTGFTVLGEWRWGPCIAAAAIGNYAYIGNGGLLQVLDVSQPATPSVVWEKKMPLVRDIKIKDSLACVSLSDGTLLFLDVSSPAFPSVLSEILLPFPNTPVNAVIASQFVYVASWLGIVFVVDISDARNPFIRGHIIATGAYLGRVASYGSFIYYVSAHQNQGLAMMIIDASDPDSLVAVNRFFDIGCGAHSLLVADTLLFVGAANYCTTGVPSIKIYSISQPRTPELLGQVIIGRQINSITREGNYVYAGTSDSGLFAIDISSLSQPRIVGRARRAIPASAWNHALTISNHTLFATQRIGLWTLSISQPDSLQPVSFFATSSDVRSIALAQDHAFVATGEAGVWVLDVSDPDSIRGVANFNPGGLVIDIAVSPPHAYVLSVPDGSDLNFWVLDITNPGQPHPLSNVAVLPGSTLSLGQGYAYVTRAQAYNDSAFGIINVTDPINPFMQAVFQTLTQPNHSVVRDTLAFLATETGGLRILSVRDPSAAYEITSLGNRALSLDLRDSLLFLSADSGFTIVDISMPSSPQILGATRTTSLGVAVSVASRFAYFGLDGVHVVDVRTPTLPREAAVWLQGNYISDLALASDSLLFVGTSWLVVLRNDIVTSVEPRTVDERPQFVRLSQNYPNPFNPATTIKYNLPIDAHVTLKLYDVLGREVLTLIDERAEGGYHSATLDGSRLSSGVYFYRMQAGAFSQTKKLLLLR